MKIIDAFLAIDEVDMIKCRMTELADVENVSHVTFETNRTFHNDPKSVQLLQGVTSESPNPLFILQTGRVCPLDFDDAIEIYHRNMLKEAIQFAVAPDDDDLVLILDADEIVAGSAIPRIIEATEDGPKHLALSMFRYSKWWADGIWYDKAIACRWKHLANWTPHEMRTASIEDRIPPLGSRDDRNDTVGWHLTYWGSPERFHRKMRTSSHDHDHYNSDYFHDHVEEWMAHGTSIDGGQLGPWDGSGMPRGCP